LRREHAPQRELANGAAEFGVDGYGGAGRIDVVEYAEHERACVSLGDAAPDEPISSVRRGRAGTGRVVAPRASNARSSAAGCTVPWNSGETTVRAVGAARREKGAATSPCAGHATQHRFAHLANPRHATARCRRCQPLRCAGAQQVHHRANDRPLFGRPRASRQRTRRVHPGARRVRAARCRRPAASGRNRTRDRSTTAR